jgi:hypothetical protein
MSIARDAILEALFQRIKTKVGLGATTFGRRHMMPPKLTSDKQPAVFVVQGPEHHEPRPRGTGGKVMLHALVIAYYYDNAANADGSTGLNILLGLIEDAIAPDQGQLVQTLGGLAYHAWIEGDADVDPGVFGQQAVAILPVRILVP